MSGQAIPRAAPRREPPAPGETPREARHRRAEYRRRYGEWHDYWYGTRCARCGTVRANVVHEQDPGHSPEGAAYHATLKHHVFEPEAKP